MNLLLSSLVVAEIDSGMLLIITQLWHGLALGFFALPDSNAGTFEIHNLE
jgi:hypothetical protein